MPSAGAALTSVLETAYLFPNDPTETDRLDFQFEIFRMLFRGRNYFAPWRPRVYEPTKVLDIGTGTGQWCLELGDEFPSAQIAGTDLSPIQPAYVPPNVRFWIEDSSEDWAQWHTPDYDYVHTRMSVGCFGDYKSEIVDKAFAYLRPGGWFEAQELFPRMHCDDGTLTDDSPLKVWSETLMGASSKASRPVDIAPKLKEWMQQAGFVDVRERVFKLPVNNWPLQRFYKDVGRLWQQNLLMGLSGLSLALLSRVEGWSVERIELFLIDVRKALSDPSIHAYNRVHVVVGRKPGSAGGSPGIVQERSGSPSDQEMAD